MSRPAKPPTEPDPGELGVRATYRDYFLQYASYVITDRAIPDSEDGLKPVQRRILHSLWENEDGRYNKVANIVGHSMKYHPHGDASIYSALVGLGQKQLLIDTQGNWGNPLTNDPAAAARYIEARLTPFAKEVVFAPELTTYQRSYDGRNLEPVTLPVRFPLLLAMGAEGIAVGLTTRILPHNFRELLEAQKAYFRKEEFELLPDFPSGGIADISGYNDGLAGSKVRVRARIEPDKGKALVIREIPFGTTTESVIDSILSANDKGKIKVSNIEDNSAAEIEIVVRFQRGVDMEKAVHALYAFTNCEVTLTTSPIVIRDGQPVVRSASQLLIDSAERTKALLKQDLQIQQEKLELAWHRKSLVQIFVEHRIYLRIEECDTWEAVLSEIDAGLEPFKSRLRREVTQEDLIYLTEVRIRRISAWDAAKAREELESIDRHLAQVKRHLRNLTEYTISYLDHLLETYGTGRERRTELAVFDTVQATAVVARTEKLYWDPAGGFIGTDPKIGEEVGACSDIDDILVILEDGGLLVTKIAPKKYVGEKIRHVQVFKPESRRTTFNLIYEALPKCVAYIKRFTIGGVTRDRRYELGKGKAGNRLLYFSAGDEHYVHVRLRKKPRIKTDLYFRLDDFLVKGRGAAGVILTRHKVSSIREISQTVYQNRTGAEAAPDEDPPNSASPDPKPASTGDKRAQKPLFSDVRSKAD